MVDIVKHARHDYHVCFILECVLQNVIKSHKDCEIAVYRNCKELKYVLWIPPIVRRGEITNVFENVSIQSLLHTFIRLVNDKVYNYDVIFNEGLALKIIN